MSLLVLLLAVFLQLPPLSWTCPMHPDVVQDASGTCPICRMPLEPVHLEQVWSCPIHSVIAQSQPGRCRICRRDLVRVTMAVTWSCADRPDAPRLEPGTCADGSAAIARYTPRPHGNHNPQHGGAFFMAPDNWHHVEGAYPRAGVFQLYLYDDYSKPLPQQVLRRVAARLETDRTRPLAVAANGEYLEARLPGGSLPARMTAKVRFKPGEPEHRFDFEFHEYTDAGAKPSDAGLKPRATYDGDADITELHERAKEIADAIVRRAFGEIWVPALRSKDVALAIEERASGPRRDAVSAAVRDLVRAAWMLDAAGDVGDARQVDEAHKRFVAAVGGLDAALGSKR